MNLLVKAIVILTFARTNLSLTLFLERVHVQKTEILDLQAQIKLVVDTHQELENEKEELKVLLTNSQLAFSEVQSELSATNEKIKHLQDKVEDYSKAGK